MNSAMTVAMSLIQKPISAVVVFRRVTSQLRMNLYIFGPYGGVISFVKKGGVGFLSKMLFSLEKHLNPVNPPCLP